MNELLSIDASTLGFEAVLRLRGELDLAGTARLVATTTAFLDLGHRRIVWDCALLTFLDAAGLGAMVRAARSAEAVGGELVLRNVDGEPLLAIATSELDRRFGVEPRAARAPRAVSDGASAAA